MEDIIIPNNTYIDTLQSEANWLASIINQRMLELEGNDVTLDIHDLLAYPLKGACAYTDFVSKCNLAERSNY